VTVWKMAIGSVVTALLLASCGGSSGDNGQSCTPTGGSTSGTPTQTVKLVADPNTIGKYDPATVSVKVGDTVAWDFQDNTAQHSVTSDDSGVFDSCLQNAAAAIRRHPAARDRRAGRGRRSGSGQCRGPRPAAVEPALALTKAHTCGSSGSRRTRT